MAKTTLIIAFIGILGFISIQASIQQARDLDPVYYNAFNEDIHYEIEKGIKKYRSIFSDAELADENFYLIFSQCEGDKTVLINYMNCVDDCAIKKMITASNRYMKINDNTVLPVILASDLANSNYFASTDGTRIRPPMEGYAIKINGDNEVVSAVFSDF